MALSSASRRLRLSSACLCVESLGPRTCLNLTSLDLFDTQSDVSPLASLTYLTGLDLGDNQIIDVSPLASLTNLTWLHLEDNPLNQESVFVHMSNFKA
jgi:hypothetical protein